MAQGKTKVNENLTDDRLAVLAQQGSDVHRMVLLNRYIPVVKSRVSGYAGGDLEPEDLAQEGMIGLLGAIDGFDPEKGASFRTFALLCIDRSVISVVRASLAAKKIPVSTLVPLEDEEIPFSRQRSPEEIVVSKDSAHHLMDKLGDSLSSLERRVFFLHLGGCDYDDIALRLEVSPKAVDNALCRARGKIKKLISSVCSW